METPCGEAAGTAVNSDRVYTGVGTASFEASPQYNFVGQGAGSHNREIVTGYHGWTFK